MGRGFADGGVYAECGLNTDLTIPIYLCIFVHINSVDMKNVTLSLPDDLLHMSRQYAEKHGTSLNEFIRNLLKQAVAPQENDPVQKLIDHSYNLSIDTKNINWTREEIYDRKIFS